MKEFMQHVAIVTALVIFFIFLLKGFKEKKRPAHLVTAEKRCLTAYEELKKAIPQCKTSVTLQALSDQVDRFYYDSFDFVQTNVLRAMVKELDRLVCNQRLKINQREKA